MKTQDDKPTGDTFSSLGRTTVAVLLVVLAFAGVKSYRELAMARAHELELSQEIAATERRILLLSERVESIETDPSALEQLAREELGWVRSDDVVIFLDETDGGADVP